MSASSGNATSLRAGLLARAMSPRIAALVAGEVPDGGLSWLRARRMRAGRYPAVRLGRVSGLGTAVGRRRASATEARVGRGGQLVDRALEALGDLLEVGQRVEVGEQAEAEPAVVGHDRDAQRLVLRPAGRRGRGARIRRPSR